MAVEIHVTRGRRANTPGTTGAAAGLLLLLALLPAPAGAADEDGMRIPFLRADGANRAPAPVAPTLLPVWASSASYGEDWDLDLVDVHRNRRWQDEPRGTCGPAWPDVSALLLDLPGASSVRGKGGRVEFQGTEEDRAWLVRRLGAVRAGFARRVRIEVDVRRGVEETRVALSGEAPLGSLLVADARESRDYPAGLQLDSSSACAEMMYLKVGPHLVASAVDTGAGYVLRLAVHLSEVVGAVRFEAERLTLVAPALAFTSLVVEAPAAPNERDTIRVGDLTITYRVTLLPSAPPPPGTRVFSLDAAAPLFAVGPLPEPGLAPRQDRAGRAESAPPHDTPTWLDRASAGVSRYDVPPGLVVLEGDEDALEKETERWRKAASARRAPLRLALALDSGLRLDVPLAPPARLVLVAGRLDPVVVGSRSALGTAVAETGPRLSELFTGRTLTVTFEDDSRPRVTETWATSASVRPRVIPIVVSRSGIVERDRLPGRSWAPTINRTSRLCRADEVRPLEEER